MPSWMPFAVITWKSSSTMTSSWSSACSSLTRLVSATSTEACRDSSTASAVAPTSRRRAAGRLLDGRDDVGPEDGRLVVTLVQREPGVRRTAGRRGGHPLGEEGGLAEPRRRRDQRERRSPVQPGPQPGTRHPRGPPSRDGDLAGDQGSHVRLHSSDRCHRNGQGRALGPAEQPRASLVQPGHQPVDDDRHGDGGQHEGRSTSVGSSLSQSPSRQVEHRAASGRRRSRSSARAGAWWAAGQPGHGRGGAVVIGMYPSLQVVDSPGYPAGADRARTSSSTRSALIAMAAAEPSPAAVITWARGLATLPATQTPGTVVCPVPSVTTQPSSSTSQPRPTSRSLLGTNRGGTNTALAGTTRPSSSSTPLQPVVL